MFPKLAYYIPPSYLVELGGFTTEASLAQSVLQNFSTVHPQPTLTLQSAPNANKMCKCNKTLTVVATGPSATNDDNQC